MIKKSPFFLQILKVWFLNTWLVKFLSKLRLFTLSVTFGFHGPYLLEAHFHLMEQSWLSHLLPMWPGFSCPQWIEPELHWKTFGVQCHISRNLPERLSPCHRNGPTTLTGAAIEPTTFGFDHRCLQFTTELQGQTKVALGHVTSRQMITNKNYYHPGRGPWKFSMSMCGHNRSLSSFPQCPLQREFTCEFFVRNISFHSYWN